jgi:histidinol dehydrogenase
VQLADAYIDQCISGISTEFESAVQTAISNIREVNEALMPPDLWEKEIREGTIIGEKTTPLESIGLWVPASKGPLISTALMLVVAARVAGVQRIVVGMPPQKDGRANPATVAAAGLAGAHEFVLGNGVAIIAGFSIGTESIPETDGIYGPGPAGIAAAMSVAFSYGKRTAVGIGPTDCAVMADETADPEWLAADLLCEGEHGPDSSAMLVTTSDDLAREVSGFLHARIASSEVHRKTTLKKVFGETGMGTIVVAPDLISACDLINDFAPEHLIIWGSDDWKEETLKQIKNTGEILVGAHTPFSAANYAIGITAVLPTNGFARAFSGITCKDMLKTSTIGKLTPSALERLRPTIKQIGNYEGLPSHVMASEIRFSDK